MAISDNEAICLMYDNTSEALIAIADFIDKNKLEREAIIKLLKDSAVQLDAQKSVVEIREQLRTGML